LPDQIQSTRIICEGGLDSTQNFLHLSANKPGCATRLINYEVGLSGGYRRLNGYQPYDSDFAEVGEGACQGKILGIIIYEEIDGTSHIIAARRLVAPDDTEYKFYEYEFATGWVEIATGLTHNYSSGGATVDKLRWDTGNDGATNYLCIVDGVNKALLYDGTTWAYIDNADTGADLANAGGAQALNAPTHVAFWKSTLFISTDVINSFAGIVAHSAPNTFYDWNSANGAGQVIPGFRVQQIKPFRDSLYCFGTNRISKVVVEGADFVLQSVTSNIGLQAPDAVVEIGGDLIFLAPDGFRPIAGTEKIGDVQLESLSKPIHNLVKERIINSVGQNVNVVVIRGKSQFRMFFGTDTRQQADSKGIIGCLRTPNQQDGWEFGELIGIRASCCASKYVAGVEIVLHGDYDGVVYRQEVGNDFNGNNVLSAYSTPYLDLGDTEVRKVIEKLTAFVQGEGSTEIILEAKYDWGRTSIPAPNPYSIDVEATFSTYDDVYDYDAAESVYGGFLTPVAVKDLEGSFFSVRFTFTTNSTDAPHSIHAMVLEYQVKGRR
jgi:hypothetical protein